MLSLIDCCRLLLFVVLSPLFVVGRCSLFVVCCSLLVVRCLLFVVCGSLFAASVFAVFVVAFCSCSLPFVVRLLLRLVSRYVLVLLLL